MTVTESLTVGFMRSNCHIVYGGQSRRAAIIDPGADEKRISRLVSSLGVTVEAIILTHGHFDHIGAAEALSKTYKCAVLIHKDDVFMLTDPAANLSAEFGNYIECRPYDLIAVGDETRNIIGADFRFIHTPGHTPGSMCIDADGALYTGDTLFSGSVGRAFPPYGSMAQEIGSIKNRLFTINGDRICYTGHGDNTTVEKEKNNNPFVRTQNGR